MKTKLTRLLDALAWPALTGISGLLLILLLIPRPASAVGQWIPLSNPALGQINLTLLLSDGTVMGSDGDVNWYRLLPANGDYVNGTWTNIAPMHYPRFLFSSQVLRDGRVFVAASEYGPGTANAEVYDPVQNTWTDAPVPQTLLDPAAGGAFADAISEILPSGSVLIAPNNPNAFSTLIYDPGSNTWTNGPPVLAVYGSQHEASWVKLPDDSILTIDPPYFYYVILNGTNYIQGKPSRFGNPHFLYVTNSLGGTNYIHVDSAERYIPSLNQWVWDTPPPFFLYSDTSEIGPAFLLPDGRAFFLGASGHTIYYTPSGSTNPGAWSPGPDIPLGLSGCDVPAAMMVNGKILCALNDIPTLANPFPPDLHFYEFDANGGFTPTSSPGDPTVGSVLETGTAFMLDLPDGSVLFSANNSQLYAYRPDTPPLASGKPTINAAVMGHLNSGNYLTGTLLNGISEGAAFGDDAQMNSNYPLVRLTNAVSGLVYYARTYNWSSTSVMTGSSLESTHFTMPASAPYGSYSLVVVANGISSDPVEVNYGPVLNISVLRHWILLNWIEGAAESGSLMNLPSFGLERADDLVSAAGGAPGFTNDIIVRSLNGQFVAREAMNAGSEYYRLNAAATNTVVPPASTLPASNVTATGAWFNGTDVPIGSNTLYWFEYGQDTNYSQTTPTNSLDTSANPVSVNFSVGGLYPLFLYHCQLVVMDDWGAQYGGDQTFTTPGLPPVVDTQPASAIGETSAQLNGTVNGEGQPIAGYFQYWYLEQTDGGNYWITNQTTPEFYGPSSYAVQAFSATVTNLNPTTTYYYQIVARNLVARVFGGVTNFTTTP